MSDMQLHGLDNINSFCNLIISIKCTNHSLNLANLVVVDYQRWTLQHKQRQEKTREGDREGYYSAHERVTYETSAVLVPYKMGHRLSVQSSRQGSPHSIIIDRFDVLGEWKV